jgi:hypothetical protein
LNNRADTAPESELVHISWLDLPVKPGPYVIVGSCANQSPARTPATAKSSAPTITAPAFRFRASFVNIHSPTVDFGTIEAVDSRFGLLRVRHLNEGESPRLPRVSVRHDIHTVNPSVLGKRSLQLVFVGPII